MFKTLLALAATAAAATSMASIAPETKTVRYQHDGVTFESVIVYHGDVDDSKPGILMIPNWMGPTDASLQKAVQIADASYFVMMVDMYGVDTRPDNASEASDAAGRIRSDRSLMRARAAKALEVFKREGQPLGLDVDRVAAIGFCFGGGAALELGRSGADLGVIASFHGDLASPTLQEDAANTRAKLLVLHGADDPYVPQSDVQQFIETMRQTEVDWQLVQYANTVHSFTDPSADSEGARYNKTSADRAFEALHALLRETWSD